MSTPANRISWWRTSFGEQEINQVATAIRGEHISQGPVVAEFERRVGAYLGVPYVVATSSGSTALLMAMMAAGVRPGDEVIVPDRTWIATAHAPALLGATVKFVDVQPEQPIIDVDRIERAITRRTKAIAPVHLNGRSADMRRIREIATKHGLRVIEDAAQAFGSRNADGFLGTQGDMGCFSLSVAKIIATGQGGFVVTSDPALYETLVAIRTHGTRSVMDAEWTQLGFNFRFTDILASIGLVQLEQMRARAEHVHAIHTRYLQGLADMDFLRMIPVDVASGGIPIYAEVLCAERSRLMEHLASSGIETRPFYPCLHLAPYFNSNEAFPNADRFGEQGIFLPSGPSQPLENIERVCNALNAVSSR
jgi:dTDP-4-amino-4,6-dideoxygalactose transaminase